MSLLLLEYLPTTCRPLEPQLNYFHDIYLVIIFIHCFLSSSWSSPHLSHQTQNLRDDCPSSERWLWDRVCNVTCSLSNYSAFFFQFVFQHGWLAINMKYLVQMKFSILLGKIVLLCLGWAPESSKMHFSPAITYVRGEGRSQKCIPMWGE